MITGKLQGDFNTAHETVLRKMTQMTDSGECLHREDREETRLLYEEYNEWSNIFFKASAELGHWTAIKDMANSPAFQVCARPASILRTPTAWRRRRRICLSGCWPVTAEIRSRRAKTRRR